MPFNIQGPELILILIIALIVIGPGKLPDVGSALGKSIREFRKAATDVKETTRLDAPASTAPASPAATAPAANAPAAPNAPAAQPPTDPVPATGPTDVQAARVEPDAPSTAPSSEPVAHRGA